MIREDGSIGTESIAVAPALNLYRKKLKIFALIGLIVGLAGVIAYVALTIVLGIKYEEAPSWTEALLIFVVPFAFGLIGTITIARLKSRERAENCTAKFVFFNDCFVYSFKSALNPEETVKRFSYSDACIKKENESYGYIFITGRGLFLVFGKGNLSENELNTIRALFGNKTTAETIELKNYKSEEKN